MQGAADLGLNPSNDGKLVRIPVPALTEERRKQLARQVHDIAEDHRIADATFVATPTIV